MTMTWSSDAGTMMLGFRSLYSVNDDLFKYRWANALEDAWGSDEL